MKYIGITLALLFSAQASAMVCVSAASDPDGDGWGWENGGTCTVSAPGTGAVPTASTPTTTSTVSACVDTDPVGDGWGWDGSSSCRVGGAPATTNPTTPVASACVDTDPVGDGWGWDGSSSCRVDGAPTTTNPTTPMASACIDTDPVGDGWGWDGSSSCRVDGAPATTNPTTPVASACVDTDPVGDGWGWDGSSSCRVDGAPTTTNPTTPMASACIDTDPVGDGWGWDGTSSCRVGGSPATTNPTAPIASVCVDTDPVGDGWGWDGSSSCRVGGALTPTNPVTPPVVSVPPVVPVLPVVTAPPAETAPPVVSAPPLVLDDDSTIVVTETDGGTFTTDTGNGNALRISSLASDEFEALCTTKSNPDDFSNIFVGDFILHNNAWRTFRADPDHEWEQCIFTNFNGALVGWNYSWGPGVSGLNGNPNASGDFFVRSYPELIYGIKDEFRTSAPKSVTGLPVRISEMPTFQIDYAFDAPQFGESRVVDASTNSRFPNGSTIQGERNVAVESFFYQPDAEGQCTDGIVTRTGGSTHAYEVMVWLDAGAERLPAGPDDYVADVTIRNAPYKVYTKNDDERYVAFVAQSPQSTGSIVMNDFVAWARENAHQVTERFGARSNSVEIQDWWCMANILVGTEIFWGAGAMNITEWTITQTQ